MLNLRFAGVVLATLLILLNTALQADNPVDLKSPEAIPVGTSVPAEKSELAEKAATPAANSPNENLSDAERVADLKQTLEGENARLKELETELTHPASEFAKAEKGFQELDREVEQKRELLGKLKADGKIADASELEKELASIEKQRMLAKDRFDLALEERKTLREEITTLRRKLQLDQEALDELTGAKPKSDDETDPADKSDRRRKKRDEDDDHDSESDGKHKSSGEMKEGHDRDDEKNNSEEKSDESHDEDDAELMQAEEEARQKDDEAEEAQEETKTIAARIADLQKLISQEQKVLNLSRKKAELAQTTQKALEAELVKREMDGASSEELQELRVSVADTRQRFSAAQADMTEAADRLNDRRTELASLQSQQILVMQEAAQAKAEAEAAHEKIEELRNPFTPRNMSQWLIDHGPRVLLIILGMFVVNQLSHFFSNRTIKLVAGGTSRGSPIERENRARTLVGVFQNACTVAIFIGGTLMVLEECGANVTVLMGGVAVIGLAVAFGAQNLIKDYFCGFVMLLENQYMLHDTIRIGDVTGQVERITLRMTVIRDVGGVVHFIPNGTINSVSNETHGWSRANIEVGVAYKEDLDHVFGVLAELARGLRADAVFTPLILEDATPPAVDSLGESSVLIKFAIKTKPNQHGVVKRELLRRIKRRFDELNIELPFPHRTVYHRYESAAEQSASLPEIKRCA